MEVTIKTIRTTIETLYITFPAIDKEDAIKHFVAGTSATGEKRFRTMDKVINIDTDNFEFVDEAEAMSEKELKHKEKADSLNKILHSIYDEHNVVLSELSFEEETKMMIKIAKETHGVELEWCEYHGLWYKDEMLLDEGRWYSPDHIRECEKCGKKTSVDQYEFAEGRCDECAW